MKVSREELNERIRTLIARLSERQTFYRDLLSQYNIPISIPADICSNRRDIDEVNDFVAFALLQILKEKDVENYFTEDEIKAFSSQRYHEEKFDLPLTFAGMTQITPDQWSGRISTKRLMEMKDAQIIKYNENTQRTLRKVVNGENRYFKIYLNRRAIEEIKEAMRSGSYIPDALTFNIPLGAASYNSRTQLMTIEALDSNGNFMDHVIPTMDILDGYHRYIAISQLVREDPTFEYTMELRLVNFTEEKAKQFIYQMDQKTQMRRMDSNSLNQYNPANIVIDQLNTSPRSNIQGEIGRNDSNIDYTILSSIITTYFFSERRKYDRREIIEVANDLQNKFNLLTTEDTSWLGHLYTLQELHVIGYCFANGISDSEKIRWMIQEAESIPSNRFIMATNGNVRRKLINELDKIAAKGGG